MKKFTIPFALISLSILIHGCRPAADHNRRDMRAALQVEPPETAGFSAARLDRIDSLFQDYVEQGDIAGAIAIIARRGKIAYYRATGYDDLESKTPLRKDAIFRVASQTKGITSVAVMMLYERGKFLLDDPLSKHLPEFREAALIDTFHEKDSSFSTLPASRQVTIRDLLTHTSGYPYPGNASRELAAIYARQGVISGLGTRGVLKEEMQKIAPLPLEHQPGEKFTYGFSTDILGYLVEETSGMSLDDFFRKEIFVPLGMNDSHFFLPEEKHGRLMCLYSENAGGALVKMSAAGEFNPDYPKTKGTLFSGGGGLSSTAVDYAIFMQMLLNGGTYQGVRLLSRSTVDMMTVNHIGELGSGSLFIPGGPDKFGLGFEVISPPGAARIPINEGAYGWGGAFGSLYWVDPEEALIAHLVIQKTNNYADIRAKFIAAVYQAIDD